MRLAFLLLPLLAGCDMFDQGDCTADERYYEVTLLLPDGSPATGASLTATNARTGITYGPCTGDDAEVGGVGCEWNELGQYVVYTDGQYQQTSERSDVVVVRASLDGRTAEAAFRFARGECHVYQRSGPDTLTLQ